MKNCLFALMLLTAAPVFAQQEVVTAEDYARAESFLSSNTFSKVAGWLVRPNWLSENRFWYRNTVIEGTAFVLVDPEAGTRERAFDHGRLASALSAASDTTYRETSLPFDQFSFTGDEKSISFDVGRDAFSCNIETYSCAKLDAGPSRPDGNSVTSPDGKRAAFVRDHNLWVRDLESGEEKELTTDGIEDFGYATNNAGWRRGDVPVLLWSPDSKKIATFQHDGRGVGEMHLTTTHVGHPKLDSWKYPLPGDSLIFRIDRVVIDVDGGEVVRLQLPADPHRSTICDHVVCRGGDG